MDGTFWLALCASVVSGLDLGELPYCSSRLSDQLIDLPLRPVRPPHGYAASRLLGCLADAGPFSSVAILLSSTSAVQYLADC